MCILRFQNATPESHAGNKHRPKRNARNKPRRAPHPAPSHLAPLGKPSEPAVRIISQNKNRSQKPPSQSQQQSSSVPVPVPETTIPSHTTHTPLQNCKHLINTLTHSTVPQPPPPLPTRQAALACLHTAALASTISIYCDRERCTGRGRPGYMASLSALQTKRANAISSPLLYLQPSCILSTALKRRPTLTLYSCPKACAGPFRNAEAAAAASGHAGRN
ncbi:hypothetical protein EDC01DRAFT_625990 [Geopyxis carbonaria]|nr:hypothetical protein EDC01DRAFT_625990 [Geopyxis carbonaria]